MGGVVTWWAWDDSGIAAGQAAGHRQKKLAKLASRFIVITHLFLCPDQVQTICDWPSASMHNSLSILLVLTSDETASERLIYSGTNSPTTFEGTFSIGGSPGHWLFSFAYMIPSKVMYDSCRVLLNKSRCIVAQDMSTLWEVNCMECDSSEMYSYLDRKLRSRHSTIFINAHTWLCITYTYCNCTFTIQSIIRMKE